MTKFNFISNQSLWLTDALSMMQLTKCRITTNCKTTGKFEPLFKPDSDWHNNACLNYGNDVTRNYIDGYKKAADRLVNDIDSDIDLLVYPIVFLYRHHVEISLKEIIESGHFLLGTKFNKKNHDLNTIWNEVKYIAKEIWDKEFPEKDFEFIDHIIREFEEHDERSTSFRYSKTRDGKNPNPDLFHINIRHLRDMIEKFNEVLSPIDCRISFYSDHIEEFRFRKLNGTL